MKTLLKTNIIILSLFISSFVIAQSDANIFGHVLDKENGNHIPFATISIKNTTIGKAADETGHFKLINLPEGQHTLVASFMGYKPLEKGITVKKGESKEVNFELEKDLLGLAEFVVTGSRSESNRRESLTMVNTISPRTFENVQSISLSDGLNFCSGLRMENNCQNCGFTQVRMNGMEGPYSQILINSRPIFSGLAGVYGLELIPSNMIDRVEVIRGGGSALYGSNAIAGTINVILRDPIKNTYEIGSSTGIIGLGLNNSGGIALDQTINFNTSLVSSDNKTGMSLFGFYRDREPFDANNDGFSEIALLKNTSIGTRVFHRFSDRNKLSLDFFNIKEERRGGNKFDYPLHESDISEAVRHDLTTAALTFEQFVRNQDKFSVYVSGQYLNRDSYYGAEQSLSDYGRSNDLTYTVGTQYNAKIKNSELIIGIENLNSRLRDRKLGFLDIENAVIVNDTIIDIPHTDNVTVADQQINTIGAFAQYEIRFNKLQLSAGARFDNYLITDKEAADAQKSGNVISPRFVAKYDISDFIQSRVSYAQGYRAPQIFDEDLHIETSGSRKVIYENSPDLIQETSHSYMASFDFNKRIKNTFFNLLVEGFYTQLLNPFANEYSDPDENGTVIYTRVNEEEGAVVKGINTELNIIPSNKLSFKAGFTFQKSAYEEEQEFDEKRFFRTPDRYGFFLVDYKPVKNWTLAANAIYTGPMLVPYFGMEIPNPEDGILRETSDFIDLGFKLAYNIKINGATLQLNAGMKNILNAYQKDFDTGIERDPGYMYGPMFPRTVYFGLKLGNFIK